MELMTDIALGVVVGIALSSVAYLIGYLLRVIHDSLYKRKNRNRDVEGKTLLRYEVDLSDRPTITNPALEQCAKNGYHLCALLEEMPDEVSLRDLLDKEYEKAELIKAAHADEIEQWKTEHNVSATEWAKCAS